MCRSSYPPWTVRSAWASPSRFSSRSPTFTRHRLLKDRHADRHSFPLDLTWHVNVHRQDSHCLASRLRSVCRPEGDCGTVNATAGDECDRTAEALACLRRAHDRLHFSHVLAEELLHQRGDLADTEQQVRQVVWRVGRNAQDPVFVSLSWSMQITALLPSLVRGRRVSWKVVARRDRVVFFCTPP